MPDTTARVRAALEAFQKGEVVVVTDDDDRENEGDLFVAASLCTPEKMAFIIRHTSGIVCAPLKADRAAALRLDPMVARNDAPLATAFTVSVDAREGLTTGISAEERTNTVRALANGNVGADAFVRPGHVFPLIAREGGVLMRSGHTEACVDMCELAGLPPVGVISELVNDDGTVMRGPDVTAFAEKHGLKRVAVADLIHYRQCRERLVERQASGALATSIGKCDVFMFTTPFDRVAHMALVYGNIPSQTPPLVRFQRENILQDVFAGGNHIQHVFDIFKTEGHGVLIYLRDGTAGVPQTQVSLEDTASAAERAREWREIGLGAQILRDLGITTITLLSNKARKYVGLEGFGIHIADTKPLSKTQS